MAGLDLSKYAELFLSEGREHVAAMQEAVLTLDARSAHGIADAQVAGAVAVLFRAAHSIKGMAAAMEYQRVLELSHALETILQGIRDGVDPLTSSLVSHLSDETDALASAIETAGQSKSQTEHTEPRGGASHRSELRTRHLRVDGRRLDALMTLAGELEIARGRLERVVRDVTAESEHNALETAVTHLSRLISNLRDQIVTTRMVPVGHVFERFPRLVRETARTLGKEVDFVLDGKDIELDRSLLDEIGDPVLHLLRNSIDHGIESPEDRVAAGKAPRGRLTLSAQRESSYVLIRVADDGRGIDRERVLGRARDMGVIDPSVQHLDDAALINVVTRAGFSTADRVTEISGRGVGLDVVDATVRALGGSLEIKSLPKFGTAITLRLPITVAIVRALLARVGTETFAIPVTHVIETIEIDLAATNMVQGRLAAMVRDQPFPMVPLRETMGFPPQMAQYPKAVTVDVRGRRAALVVDDFIGQQDIVVKQFDAPRGAPALFGGATILNDGAPALIIDVNSLV